MHASHARGGSAHDTSNAAPTFVDVFVPKRDGFASIRIPSVVVTPKGTVLAFAEGRAADADQARNQILLKRSEDGGRTWSAVRVIATDGAKSLNNPCTLVEGDSVTGRIFLMYQSYPEGIGERSDALQTGLTGERIVRSLVCTSDDDGLTWSEPRDITAAVKRPTVVTTLASGPGRGIRLQHGPHAGRLLFPFNEGPFGQWNIYAVYSDDGGKTWQRGAAAPGNLVKDTKGIASSQVNEAQFVEIGYAGVLRFNVRRWAGTHAVRKTALSYDDGAHWSAIEDTPDLPDPSCMGSVLRGVEYLKNGGKPPVLLYSGAGSTRRRENGTLYLSYDSGATWPAHRVLYPGSFAYSCLTWLPNHALGCLFEADDTHRIVFARVSPAWIKEAAPPALP